MVGANGASSRGADTYKSLDLDYHFVLPSPLLAVIAVMPPQQRGPSRHGTAEKSGCRREMLVFRGRDRIKGGCRACLLMVWRNFLNTTKTNLQQ